MWKHFEEKLKILRFAPTFLAKPRRAATGDVAEA
jgi:hypothetical protein